MSVRERLFLFASRYLDAFLPVQHPVLQDRAGRRRLRLVMGASAVFIILATSRLPFVVSEGGRRVLLNLLVIVWYSSVVGWTIWQRARYLTAVSFSLVVVSVAHNACDSYLHPFYPGHNVPFIFAMILGTHLVFGRWVSLAVLIVGTGMYIPLIGSSWPSGVGAGNPHFLAYQANFSNNTIMAALMIWLISEAYDHFREESEQNLLRVNREREADLELAQNLHRELFPPAGRYGPCRFFAVSKPASTVGGDYCEAMKTDRSSWFAIGDVSGHGLQAGMLVMQIRAMLVYLVSSRSHLRPSLIFVDLNNTFYEIVKKLNIRSYMTFFILRVEADGACCGVGSHQKLIILRRRERIVEVLPTHGVWLGLERLESDTRRLAEIRFRLEEGDLLVTYTDGLTEVRNRSGEQYGLDRSIETLRGLVSRPELPDERQVVETLFLELDQFRAGQAVEDDITVACICMDSGAAAAE